MVTYKQNKSHNPFPQAAQMCSAQSFYKLAESLKYL